MEQVRKRTASATVSSERATICSKRKIGSTSNKDTRGQERRVRRKIAQEKGKSKLVHTETASETEERFYNVTSTPFAKGKKNLELNKRKQPKRTYQKAQRDQETDTSTDSDSAAVSDTSYRGLSRGQLMRKKRCPKQIISTKYKKVARKKRIGPLNELLDTPTTDINRDDLMPRNRFGSVFIHAKTAYYRCNLKATLGDLKKLKFNDYHLKCIRKTPFWLLFNALYKSDLRGLSRRCAKYENNIRQIIRCYDTKTRNFILAGQYLHITSMDAQLILGVTGGPKEIPIKVSEYTVPPWVRRCFETTIEEIDSAGKYYLFKGCIMDRLVKVLESNTEESCQDVARLVCCYLLASFLAPTRNGSVNWYLTCYLEDLEAMYTYDWCEFIVGLLMNQVHKTKSMRLSGCAMLLPYWLCEYTKLIEPCEDSSIPRFLRWDLQELQERLRRLNIIKMKPKYLRKQGLTPHTTEKDTFRNLKFRWDTELQRVMNRGNNQRNIDEDLVGEDNFNSDRADSHPNEQDNTMQAAATPTYDASPEPSNIRESRQKVRNIGNNRESFDEDLCEGNTTNSDRAIRFNIDEDLHEEDNVNSNMAVPQPTDQDNTVQGAATPVDDAPTDPSTVTKSQKKIKKRANDRGNLDEDLHEEDNVNSNMADPQPTDQDNTLQDAATPVDDAPTDPSPVTKSHQKIKKRANDRGNLHEGQFVATPMCDASPRPSTIVRSCSKTQQSQHTVQEAGVHSKSKELQDISAHTAKQRDSIYSQPVRYDTTAKQETPAPSRIDQSEQGGLSLLEILNRSVNKWSDSGKPVEGGKILPYAENIENPSDKTALQTSQPSFDLGIPSQDDKLKNVDVQDRLRSEEEISKTTEPTIKFRGINEVGTDITTEVPTVNCWLKEIERLNTQLVTKNNEIEDLYAVQIVKEEEAKLNIENLKQQVRSLSNRCEAMNKSNKVTIKEKIQSELLVREVVRSLLFCSG